MNTPHFAQLDDLPVCVLGLSHSGVTVAANPIALGVLSQRFESVLDRPFASFFHEDHRVQIDRVFAQAKRAGRAFAAGLALSSDSAHSDPDDATHVVDIHVAMSRAGEQRQVSPSASAETPLATQTPAPDPAALDSSNVVAIVTLLDASARVRAEEEAAELRRRIAELERNRTRLADIHEGIAELEQPVMVGSSLALRGVREQVARVAPTNTTVLIHGETGSGKELVARSIHAASPRSRARRSPSPPSAAAASSARDAPPGAFIAVNCAALPEALVESELFGHERGAFTGADRRRLGKFELADGGTLFLDEVAELPLQAQAKLLRILQEGVFERVGGAESIRVDARIIAATHRDLARQVERGRFREDLFYRLNVFRIAVPPLRQRKEDLRELTEHLHERIAHRLGRQTLKISESSLRRILAYHWPGNIRELANAVERATLLADSAELEIQLPESPASDAVLAEGGSGFAAPGAPSSNPVHATRDILLDLTLEQLQRLHITHALEACSYRVFGPRGAARLLDLNPNTLLSKMDKFGIPRPRVVRARSDGS